MSIKLTPMETRIVRVLLFYRGMTCNQLTNVLNSSFYHQTTSTTSVHNHLKRLATRKVIKSAKLNNGDGSGSLYFLTKKGYDFVKFLFGIDYGNIGDGFTQSTGLPNYSDLEYEVHKPPSDQLAHHLLIVDILMTIETNFSPIEVASRQGHYAVKNYYYNRMDSILRPDAELKLANNNLYCIEADRITENYEQLVSKFKNYRAYFDTLSLNDLPSGILFVVSINENSPGFKRRWMTVLSAFIHAVGKKYLHLVNLIMTSKDNLVDTLNFEINLNVTHDYYSFNNEIRTVIGTSYNLLTKYNPLFKRDFSHIYFYSSNNKYKAVFISYAHQFESRVYGKFLHFVYRFKKPTQELLDKLKSLNYEGFIQIIIRKNTDEQLPLNFKKGAISGDIIEELDLLSKSTTIIKYD